MESGDRDESALSSPIWRLRVLAGAIALVALTFIQRPGRIVGDTKADLVIDPGAFLSRALSLWDPNGAWGQVQNQAYGYLWPMGPFFWVGDAIGLPEWVIQRLWWSLILVTAYLGMIVLLHALKVGKPWAQILGGFAFALSPRMISVIGPTSIEVWPLALAPWVLAPLVLATTTKRNPKYLAALSAIAVAMVGGVNAAATFAVIPLGALWILMSPKGPRRRTLMLFWPLFVLMGTLWWLIPLFLLASVSPPFLDFIESAETTTFAATITDALRGTTAWVPYVEWASRTGRALVSTPIVMVNSFVVMGLGLIGITFAPKRLRRFLVVSLITGLVLVTFGNQFSFISDQALSMLDGPLSPLRNNHKFDPVIRVVMVVGLVLLVSSMPSPTNVRITPRRGFFALAIAAVIGTASPALSGALPNLGTFREVPGYWYDAAEWFNTKAEPGNVLILPGSSFSENLWGNPRDEVFQALMDRPWSVRNAIPLTPPGTIRTLDSLERAFATGEGSPALEAALARNGIRYLVVRSDLDAKQPATSSIAVRAALADMPSIKRVRWFGPKLGSQAFIRDTDGTRLFIANGQGEQGRAIEIFEVRGTRITNSMNTAEVPVIFGDGEALLDPNLAGFGAVVMATDETEMLESADVILTDSYRLREAAFGRVIRNRSASMTTSEEYSAKRKEHDYGLGFRSLSTRRLIGATRITASSSQAQSSSGNIQTAFHPWFAFDSDVRTRWVADPAQFQRMAWIDIELEEKTQLDGTSVRLSGNQPDRKLQVTADGKTFTVKAEAGVKTSLRLEGVSAQSLRISAPTSGFFPLSITDVDIPNVNLSRPLVLPSPKGSGGDVRAVSLQAEGPQSPPCIRVSGVLRCTGVGPDYGEDYVSLDRIIRLNRPQVFPMAMKVRALSGPQLERALTGDQIITVSSRRINEVHEGALALIDGDETTGWIANASDVEPTLFIQFSEPRDVSLVSLHTDNALPASVPRSGVITFSDGSQQQVEFNRWSQSPLKLTTTNSIRIRITDWFTRRNLGQDQRKQDLPVGVSEVLINGRSPIAERSVSQDLGCGSGPSLEVNGSITTTKLRASIADVLSGRSLPVEFCGASWVALSQGENRVTVTASGITRAEGLFLGDASVMVNRPQHAQLTGNQTNIRLNTRLSGESVQYIAQNENPGWASKQSPIVINGWMQGWISNESQVAAEFNREGNYRWGLIAGGGLFILPFLAAWYWRNRPSPAPSNRRLTRNLMVLWIPVLPVVGLVLAGLPAAGVIALGSVIGFVTVTWARLFSAIGLLVVTTSYALLPWGSSAGWAGGTDWVHWISSLCVGLVVGTALNGDQSFKRMRGSSISR